MRSTSVGVQLSVISDPTQATFHTCVTAFMFDLTYTAVILQNVLLVTEKYILKIGPNCLVLAPKTVRT